MKGKYHPEVCAPGDLFVRLTALAADMEHSGYPLAARGVRTAGETLVSEDRSKAEARDGRTTAAS